MSIWVYWLDTSGAQIIFYNGNTGRDGYGLMIISGLCGASANVALLLGGLSCDALTSGSYSLPNGQWTFLVLTRDSSTWILYADGVAVKSGTLSPLSVPTGSTEISDRGALNGFHGYMDDARFYERVLSAQEIEGLYLSKLRLNLDNTSLKLWWRLDDGVDGATASGATIRDYSGIGNTGTATNNPVSTASTWINYP